MARNSGYSNSPLPSASTRVYSASRSPFFSAGRPLVQTLHVSIRARARLERRERLQLGVRDGPGPVGVERFEPRGPQVFERPLELGVRLSVFLVARRRTVPATARVETEVIGPERVRRELARRERLARVVQRRGEFPAGRVPVRGVRRSREIQPARAPKSTFPPAESLFRTARARGWRSRAGNTTSPRASYRASRDREPALARVSPRLSSETPRSNTRATRRDSR